MMLMKACVRERLQYIYIVKKEEEDWGTKETKEKEVEVLWDVNSVVSETGTKVFRNLLPPFSGSPLFYPEFGGIGFLRYLVPTSTELHGAKSQKTAVFISTTVGALNLTQEERKKGKKVKLSLQQAVKAYRVVRRRGSNIF
jgi:hypothetical protein